MSYISFKVKLLALTFVVISVLVTAPQVESGKPIIEQPTTTAAIKKPRAIAVVHRKKKTHNVSRGDCKEYGSLIGKYNWPVRIAMEICKNESHGNPSTIGDGNTAHVSCGLMQIRTLPGRPSCDKLKNPEFNVEVAYNIWQKEGFHPWSTYEYSLASLGIVK